MKTIKEIKIPEIECDRCSKMIPNHPHFIGKFHPSQVNNPDSRLGFYYICKDFIAGK